MRLLRQMRPRATRTWMLTRMMMRRPTTTMMTMKKGGSPPHHTMCTSSCHRFRCWVLLSEYRRAPTLPGRWVCLKVNDVPSPIVLTLLWRGSSFNARADTRPQHESTDTTARASAHRTTNNNSCPVLTNNNVTTARAPTIRRRSLVRIRPLLLFNSIVAGAPTVSRTVVVIHQRQLVMIRRCKFPPPSCGFFSAGSNRSSLVTLMLISRPFDCASSSRSSRSAVIVRRQSSLPFRFANMCTCEPPAYHRRYARARDSRGGQSESGEGCHLPCKGWSAN